MVKNQKFNCNFLTKLIVLLFFLSWLVSQFTFLGFLPVKGKQRKSSIETIKSSSHVIVFFEALHRLLKTFTELSTEDDGHSERLCVCCREISKIHEEIWRGTVSEAIVWMNQMVNGNDDNSNQEKGEKEKNSEGRIRGEFTVVLGPWKKKGLSKEEISHNVKEMLEKLK